ncbi:Uncharacterised protein [Fusicatenibacter sp. 2789STDY5834925]|nr:Uncharacterised protein [Fusicatenibacter sp. 2789STDY5834925]
MVMRNMRTASSNAGSFRLFCSAYRLYSSRSLYYQFEPVTGIVAGFLNGSCCFRKKFLRRVT